jgi:hypothetical protein
MRTLEDVLMERVLLIVNAECELLPEDWALAVDLEEKLTLGLEMTPKELAWVNQTIEKYELERR